MNVVADRVKTRISEYTFFMNWDLYMSGKLLKNAGYERNLFYHIG